MRAQPCDAGIRRDVGVAVDGEAAQEVARVVQDPVVAGDLPVHVPQADRRVARSRRSTSGRRAPPCRRGRRTAPVASCRSRRGRRESGQRELCAASRRRHSAPSATPVRGRPVSFWNASSASVSSSPKTPSARTAKCSAASRASSARTLAPRLPGARRGCTTGDRECLRDRGPAWRRPRAHLRRARRARSACRRLAARPPCRRPPDAASRQRAPPRRRSPRRAIETASCGTTTVDAVAVTPYALATNGPGPSTRTRSWPCWNRRPRIRHRNARHDGRAQSDVLRVAHATRHRDESARPTSRARLLGAGVGGERRPPRRPRRRRAAPIWPVASCRRRSPRCTPPTRTAR